MDATPTTPTTLARLIKTARVDAGLTQVDLAAKIGTVQSTISAWESGKAKPNTAYILDLARATGADRDAFYAGLTYKPAIETYKPFATLACYYLSGDHDHGSGDAAAEGYLARIDTWVQQQFGKKLADAGIPAHVMAVGEETPAALLQRLQEICHVAEQVRV